MNTNDEIFKLYESINKYGEIEFFRLEKYGNGSRFGSKFAGPTIKNGLYQGAGIYVFSDLDILKQYINDDINDDIKKSNKGKLCEKIIVDKNNINFPDVQFDMELHMGEVNPLNELIAEYAVKHIDSLIGQKVENGVGKIGKIDKLLPEGGCRVVVRYEDGCSSCLSLLPKNGVSTHLVPIVEKIIQVLHEIDVEFKQKYNDFLLKSITQGKGFGYKITNNSIIKNIYYFYADKLFAKGSVLDEG